MNETEANDYFEHLIKTRNVEDRWGDSLFEIDAAERRQRIQKNYREAKANLNRMLRSPKNDGSEGYGTWAVETALNVRPTKAKGRATYWPRPKRHRGHRADR